MGRIVVWLLMLFGGGITSLWMDWHCFRAWLFNPILHLISLLIGVYGLRLVMRASRNTGRWLARNGREGNIPRLETNKLVTTGYYECMIHPMHLGLLLFPVSFALILGSLSFIFIVAPLEILFIIAMIKVVEEPGAIRKFGNQYRSYQKQDPTFTARPSCLKQLFGIL